jgi:hypothetical protein
VWTTAGLLGVGDLDGWLMISCSEDLAFENSSIEGPVARAIVGVAGAGVLCFGVIVWIGLANAIWALGSLPGTGPCRMYAEL